MRECKSKDLDEHALRHLGVMSTQVPLISSGPIGVRCVGCLPPPVASADSRGTALNKLLAAAAHCTRQAPAPVVRTYSIAKLSPRSRGQLIRAVGNPHAMLDKLIIGGKQQPRMCQQGRPHGKKGWQHLGQRGPSHGGWQQPLIGQQAASWAVLIVKFSRPARQLLWGVAAAMSP